MPLLVWSVDNPIFPTGFNATLAKVAFPLDVEPIQWTKLYYDFSVPGSKFDFYNSYVNEHASWTLNCTILFAQDLSVWFIFPDIQRCHLRSKDLITFSPDFFVKLGAKFTGEKMVRGMLCDEWSAPDPDDPSHIMKYYARKSDGLPVRSPNQINDPGATDFMDIMVGSQDPELFEVPDYCYNMPPTTLTCG